MQQPGGMLGGTMQNGMMGNSALGMMPNNMMQQQQQQPNIQVRAAHRLGKYALWWVLMRIRNTCDEDVVALQCFEIREKMGKS